MSRLLSHCRKVLDVPLTAIFAWTDSTIVLSWLRGNPRRFKPFVGNRVTEVMELVLPDRWQHVPGVSNPADWASRGLYPSELIRHDLWWKGPSWMYDPPSNWPVTPELADKPEPSEERTAMELPIEVVLLVHPIELPLLERVSSYGRLKHITAWIHRFIHNCRARKEDRAFTTGALTRSELIAAEEQWIVSAQHSAFPNEFMVLRRSNEVASGQSLALQPFLDTGGLMRVGGRLHQSMEQYSKRHPLIMPNKHRLTKLIIKSEHLRLLHAGPTLVAA